MIVDLTEEERLALLEALSDALENYAQESTSYDADLRAVRAKLAAPQEKPSHLTTEPKQS